MKHQGKDILQRQKPSRLRLLIEERNRKRLEKKDGEVMELEEPMVNVSQSEKLMIGVKQLLESIDTSQYVNIPINIKSMLLSEA